MIDEVTSRSRRELARRNPALCIAIAAAFMVPSLAGAFEVDTGNEDLSIRFDNTVRANVSIRAENQDKAILANVNFDDADRSFDQGHMFARLDLLSEFDVVYKKSMGFRVSAAGWWDPGYSNLSNQSVDTANNLKDGMPSVELDPHAKRYAQGPSAEFLDVFGFAKFDVGDVPVNVKLGQTTVYWGEGLLLGGAIHGVSYSQNPIDAWKGYATPGAEAKELYRPRVGFNVQAQLTNTLSVAGQYFFNWQSFENQAYRYPEAGSYLSAGDPLLWAGESFILGPNPFKALVPGAPAYLRAWHGKDILPEENTGNYGVAVRWSPEWADATIGAYYRRTYDMQPQLMLTPGVLPSAPVLPPTTCAAIGGKTTSGNVCIVNQAATNPADLFQKGKLGEYNLSFGEDIDIYGLSLSKQLFGISVGAELNYRQNMPLVSEAVFVLTPGTAALLTQLKQMPASAIVTTDVPEHGTPGALGDTMHGVLNLLGVMGGSPLWDAASWASELTWMTVVDVTQNEAAYKGRDNKKFAPYQQLDRPSSDYFGLGINFTPTWFQVFPAVDLLAPLSWSQGISGNSAVTQGGNDGAGSFSIGIAADVRQKYRFDLKYIGVYGDYSKCPRKGLPAATYCPDGSMDVNNGVAAGIADRDFIALTFKTTF